MLRTHAKKGWFARLVETMRFGMAGSGTLGPSSLKLGSGLPSMFVIQDMVVLCKQECTCSTSLQVRLTLKQLITGQKMEHLNIR